MSARALLVSVLIAGSLATVPSAHATPQVCLENDTVTFTPPLELVSKVSDPMRTYYLVQINK